MNALTSTLGGLSIVAVLACNMPTPTTHEESCSSAQAVVAKYEGREISLREVDHRVGEAVFRLRAQALNDIIADDLFDREAKRRGLGVDELIEQEVRSKTSVPSKDELRAMYAAAEREGELGPGATYDRFREHMLGMAKQHGAAERRMDFLHELMRAAGVRRNLDALGLNRLSVQLSDSSPSRGGEHPEVAIVEFSDFTGAACAQGNATVRDVLVQQSDKVRVFFKQNPTSARSDARLAAEAALCAHEQNRYWEYRQVLFANQDQFTADSLASHARTVGIKEGPFTECLQSGRAAAAVSKDIAEAKRLELDGSPEFVVNGIRLSGAPPLKSMLRIVHSEMNRLRGDAAAD